MRKKCSKHQITDIESSNFIQLLQLQLHNMSVKILNESFKAVHASECNSDTCLAVVFTSE